MLHNIFKLLDSSTKNINITYKNSYIRFVVNCVYTLLFYLFNKFNILLITPYLTFLKSNKLSLKHLPKTIKHLIISFSNSENFLYGTFFGVNNTSIYVERLLKYSFFHKLAAINVNNKINYYNELNTTKTNLTEIANFYHQTSLNFLPSKNIAIMYYFFNKIIFTNFSYIY